MELLERPLRDLCAEARALRDQGHGGLVTYSPKFFIPLTKLCRDVCHYCTFARPPRRGERAYLSIDEVLDIARAGAAVGCREALFTLGDKPELRYRAAREELEAFGCETTLEYLARAAEAVLVETGLLPHLNPGVMTRHDVRELRRVSASMGLMLETTSARLSERGGRHFARDDRSREPRSALARARPAAQGHGEPRTRARATPARLSRVDLRRMDRPRCHAFGPARFGLARAGAGRRLVAGRRRVDPI